MSCQRTASGVTHPLTLVVPISLYVGGEQLHVVLADYKRSMDPTVRARHTISVAGLLHRFLHEHGSHVAVAAGMEWDSVTTVPSKNISANPDAHALVVAVKLAKPVAGQYRPLLRPNRPELISRAVSSDRGYSATTEARGRRVLLIDDTFTSGGTFQSAASALALGGATVVAGLVIGRYMRPDFSAEAAALWERQRTVPFDFDVCCLE